jgi:hypothetical protein
MPDPMRFQKGQWIWFAWLAAFFALTAKPFLWHVEYFKSPGPRFYTLFLVALPVIATALLIYSRLRRAKLWRYEPLAVAAVLAAAFLAYEPLATLVTLSVLAACYATGRAVRRRLALEIEDAAGDVAVSAAIGYGLLSYVLFWLGLAHLYYPVVFVLLITLPCAAFYREIPALGRACHRLWTHWAGDEELRRPLAGVLVVFGALFAAVTAMVTLAPSVVFDALKMHLTLAVTFAGQHSLHPLPLLDYSYFPQGVEVLMAASCALAGQPGAQMVAPVFFALALLLLASIVRRSGASRLSALAGMTAAVSMPFLHWSGSVAKNDMALALYQLAALDAYLRWRENGRFRWIWLGTFLLATSFGVKHVALLGGVAIGLLYLHAVWREKRRWLAVATLGVIFAVFGLCWHARAYWLTGNPVYPERLSHSVSLDIRGRPRTLGQKILYRTSRPWRLLYNGKPFFESPLEYPMGVVLLMSLPVWLLMRRREGSPVERACLLFVAVALAYWVYHIPALRYALAPLGLLVALTAARLPWLGAAYGRWCGGTVAAALTYALLFGACGILIVEVNAPQICYFARRLDKAGYLREAMRTYRSIEFLRGAAKPGERIFGVGNGSYAYAPEPANMQCYMNRNEVYTDTDAQRIRAILLAGDFQYLIVPQGAPGAVVLRSAGQLVDAAPAYQDPYFAVYRVPVSPLGASQSQQSLQR